MQCGITRDLYAPAPDARTSERRAPRYADGTGLRRLEHRGLQRESDWSDADAERESPDNGRTWGPWRDVYRAGYEQRGADEIMWHDGEEAYHPGHRHFVSLSMRRIFFGGHKEAYARYWSKGEAGFADHTYLAVRSDGGETRVRTPVRYEEGPDPDGWATPADTARNRAYLGNGLSVLDDGGILFALAADIGSCCRIRGLDLAEVFPSCPDIMCGLVVVRGRYDAAAGRYALSFSRPVVIDDRRSSRGVCEPEAMMLPSGRILAVFRGSNVESRNWRTRIEPGTPCHKWYCWSDDGGATFTDPMPWHFDDREVLYSAATFSRFVRSARNGGLYWIGNLSGPETYGNHPRYPLVIVAINDRGLPVKESLTVIDTRREGDGEKLQLSNFSILQDRETGLIELYLSKIGQRPEAFWQGDCWRYRIAVPEKRT